MAVDETIQGTARRPAETRATPGKIAITGMACRVPGARDPASFWRDLCAGREAIRAFSDEELLAAGVDPDLLRHPDYVKAGTVIDGADRFDASFFYLSGREAEKMDPQLRLFLEVAWEALESAGQSSESYDGSIGVFAGSFLSTYLLAHLYANPAEHAASMSRFMADMQARIGNDPNYLASRAAYHLGLDGPSVAVQTACSTSLVAVHLAAQSLILGECDMALAGGVSLRFPQVGGYLYERDGMVSPDGRCRPFDARAQGTVFGNGLGVVVLKRLEDALAEGDPVWAVILGSALGNDGSDRVGFAAPSSAGQTRVLAEAVDVAGVDPATVSYVETHGTGTAMGDPIELEALGRVYGRRQAADGPCVLGSVKSNLGHLSIAAGVVSLIKTALMLRHRRIPPTLHFESWNPRCDPLDGRFEVAAEARDWRGAGSPRRAAVSSFGMGGTNVHLVLEEAPASRASGAARPFQIVPLSAKSPEALAAARRRAVDYLHGNPGIELADLAHTYALGRRTFNHRVLLLASEVESAAHALDTNDPRHLFEDSGQPAPRPVAFLFPGQGAQHARMGIDAYRNEPVYREAFDECAEHLLPRLGLDLRDVLYPGARGSGNGAGKGPPDDLRRTDLAQPALFAMEYALAQLWRRWGVVPEAMIGHSIGEYVAACLAGVFSLADALRVVAARGRLVQELPPGTMVAVPLPADEVRSLLAGDVAVAAVNEPGACTISGPDDGVQTIVERLARDGVRCRRLHTSHAFHSPMMEPAREALREVLEDLELRPPRIPFLSNLTGTWITAEQAVDPAYWANHLRRPVLFAQGLGELLADGGWVLLEVGPGQTLANFARRHPGRETGQQVWSSGKRSRTPGVEYQHLLTTAGRFWLAGLDLDWAGFYAHQTRRRLALPTYPFESLPYWLEPGRPVFSSAGAEREPHRLELDQWFYVPAWRRAPAVPAAGDETLRWLVFEDDLGVGAHLAGRLAGDGHDVVRVRAGDAFERVDESTFRLRQAAPEDYGALVRTLSAEGRAPQRLVHAWSVARDGDGEPTSESFEACQTAGLYSLLSLVQALHREEVSEPMRLAVLTTGANLVSGEENPRPEKAPVAVACKVISQEHEHLHCRQIDLPAIPESGKDRDRLLAHLEREVRGDAEPEPLVALRGPFRWTQDFSRLAPGATHGADPRLRRHGVYLITGGLGEIGSTLAEMLATDFDARLALLVRDEPRPREEWDQVLEAEPDGDEALRIRRARRLESLGAEVLIVSADVAREDRLAAAVQRVEEHYGALHGVIHAAGLPGEAWDRTVLDTGVEQCRWHFEAKVHGVIALGRVLEGRELDFCLLISSLAGVLGGLRLLAYGAANHFMDAAAQRAALLGPGRTRWVSIDWDVWQHHQEEKRALSAIGSMMDDKAVQPPEGLEVIRRVLSLEDTPQVAISTWDLELRLDRWVRRRPREAPAAAPAGPDRGRARRPSGRAPSEPLTELETSIVGLIAAALGTDELGLHDDIFELGGDSLMIVRLLSEIRTVHGTDVPLAAVLDDPTPAALVALLEASEEEYGAHELLRDMEELDAAERLELLTAVEALAAPEVAAALRA